VLHIHVQHCATEGPRGGEALTNSFHSSHITVRVLRGEKIFVGKNICRGKFIGEKIKLKRL